VDNVVLDGMVGFTGVKDDDDDDDDDVENGAVNLSGEVEDGDVAGSVGVPLVCTEL